MANEKTPDNAQGKKNGERKDSDLGNLPPLSEFDSSGGQQTPPESNLPPLGSFDSDKGGKESVGGLPPFGEISLETPKPTGGNIKPPPPGYEIQGFASSSFEEKQQRREAKEKQAGGTSFQDLAADSDFSPETPEIGPGPEADVDTPMFDSAFGAKGGSGFTPTFDTPAPTQAMETPMFGATPAGAGAAPEAPAFDEGAFSPGAGFDIATPAPDFGADTGMPMAAPAPAPSPVKPTPAKKPAPPRGGGPGLLAIAAMVIVALAVGLVAGPFLSTKIAMMPNPLKKVVSDSERTVADLRATIERMQRSAQGGEQAPVDPEKINQLLQQQEQLTTSINELTAKQQTSQHDLDTTLAKLEQVRSDLENQNEEFVQAQEAFEDLQNQTSIVQARQMGLVAEVNRLTDLVGGLEDANLRRQATKDALVHSVERLLVQVKEGIPLTPERYNRDSRTAAVEALLGKTRDAKWVTPELLNEYTNIYTRELELSGATAYFFAKIPVKNRYGEPETKWAECLMKGNWAVYYRTLDGKNIGIYQNTAAPGEAPVYQFTEGFTDKVQKAVEEEITASRTEGYEERLKVLAQKQLITEGSRTPLQQTFDSL